MATLVGVKGGYVNLDKVLSAKWDDSGSFTLYGEDGVLEAEVDDFSEKIISLVPVQGEWVCHHKPSSLDEGGVWSEPVVAWGLAVDGFVRAVTPSCPYGIGFPSAVQKMGRPELYGNGSIYPDLAAWVSARSR